MQAFERMSSKVVAALSAEDSGGAGAFLEMLYRSARTEASFQAMRSAAEAVLTNEHISRGHPRAGAWLEEMRAYELVDKVPVPPAPRYKHARPAAGGDRRDGQASTPRTAVPPLEGRRQPGGSGGSATAPSDTRARRCGAAPR